MTFLELQDIRVQRGGRNVLTVAQMSVEQGEVLAVVGPNGAGKSTLLLTLARLLKPSDGEIFLRQQSITNIPNLAYRRCVALVLQSPLLLDMTVFDNVAVGLRWRGAKHPQLNQTVETWLDRLGIACLSDRRATELSGGEAQRVSLARALALEPELLLLDEPFLSLDPPTSEQLLSDLAGLLAEMKTTTVLITHDLQAAERLGDRLAVLLNGVLRQVGPAEDLRNSRDREVADFVKRA